MIYGNAIGGTAPIKTLILTDENGVEVVGTVVENLTVFDADPVKDIRAGKKAVTDAGVVTGSTTIPNYETTRGNYYVRPGFRFEIPTLSSEDKYDYTFLQCIVTLFNTNVGNSVSAEYVVINDVLYEPKNTSQISVLTKNQETKTIDFNIINNSENIYIIRYVTYKEVV